MTNQFHSPINILQSSLNKYKIKCILSNPPRRNEVFNKIFENYRAIFDLKLKPRVINFKAADLIRDQYGPSQDIKYKKKLFEFMNRTRVINKFIEIQKYITNFINTRLKESEEFINDNFKDLMKIADIEEDKRLYPGELAEDFILFLKKFIQNIWNKDAILKKKALGIELLSQRSYWTWMKNDLITTDIHEIVDLYVDMILESLISNKPDNSRYVDDSQSNNGGIFYDEISPKICSSFRREIFKSSKTVGVQKIKQILVKAKKENFYSVAALRKMDTWKLEGNHECDDETFERMWRLIPDWLIGKLSANGLSHVVSLLKKRWTLSYLKKMDLAAILLETKYETIENQFPIWLFGFLTTEQLRKLIDLMNEAFLEGLYRRLWIFPSDQDEVIKLFIQLNKFLQDGAARLNQLSAI